MLATGACWEDMFLNNLLFCKANLFGRVEGYLTC